VVALDVLGDLESLSPAIVVEELIVIWHEEGRVRAMTKWDKKERRKDEVWVRWKKVKMSS
jgi:hypothetical protein